MKFAALIFVLAYALVVAGEGKRCGSSDDCDKETECCVVRGIFGFSKGDCKKLAQEDKMCNPKDGSVKAVHGDQYILFCPCTAGFKCEVTKVKELPFIGNVTIEQKCTPNAL